MISPSEKTADRFRIRNLSFGFAIPTYHNSEALRRCLESVQQFTQNLLSRTTVVDDSGDGQVASELKRDFPSVNWIIHQENQGFGRAATTAIQNCMTEVVILLNDDVTLTCDPVPELERLFADPSIFAVTFQSHDANGGFREGAKRLVWRMGFPKILHNPADQLPAIDGLPTSAYAVGGHAAYRREMFLSLNGFDDLYRPFYWEDVDICQRASRCGWRTVYEPAVVVRHDGPSTIREHSKPKKIRIITLRNRILFARRHCPSDKRTIQRIGFILRRFMAFLKGDGITAKAFYEERNQRETYGDIGLSRSHPERSEAV